MLSKCDEIVNIVFDAINACKHSAFDAGYVSLDFYLDIDLGINAEEMKKIWSILEKRLDVIIQECEKRDVNTINDLINILTLKKFGFYEEKNLCY